MGRQAMALAVLALSAVALLICNAPAAQQPSSLAALRLPEPQHLTLPDRGYQTGFPESYFASEPNLQSKYAWVCPGPSRLDDSHSGACPESGTGGFRCCVNAETGGAVTDDMCCPALESQRNSALSVPSASALSKRLSPTLERVVLKLEQAAQPKPPEVRESYISTAEAETDLDSYFDTFSGVPAPKRSLASSDAKDDLNSFFHELSKGHLAGLAFQRKPWKAPPLLDPTREVKTVVMGFAKEVHDDLKSTGAARSKQQFEDWRERSMRRNKRPSVMQMEAAEQASQQDMARRLGKATADDWNKKQVHYYTATLGGRHDDDGVIDLGDGLVGVRAAQVAGSFVKSL